MASHLPIEITCVIVLLAAQNDIRDAICLSSTDRSFWLGYIFVSAEVVDVAFDGGFGELALLLGFYPTPYLSGLRLARAVITHKEIFHYASTQFVEIWKRGPRSRYPEGYIRALSYRDLIGAAYRFAIGRQIESFFRPFESMRKALQDIAPEDNSKSS